MSLDITELNVQFGAYHRKKQQEIEKKLLLEDVTSRYLTVVPATIDELAITMADMTEVTQAYQSDLATLTPLKGDLQFKGRKIGTDVIAVAFGFDPVTLKKSWEAELSMSGMTPAQLPITQLIMDRLIEKVVHERESLQIGRGVKVAVVAGTATPAIGAMDGFLKKLTDAIAALPSIVVKTGTFTANTIAEYVNDMVNAIPTEYAGQMMYAYCSVKNARLYRKDSYVDNAGAGMQIIYQPTGASPSALPNGVRADGSIEVPIDGTNIVLVGLPSMGDSNRIFITPKKNFKKVVDMDSMYFYPMQQRGFNTYIYGRYSMGVGFTYNELIWANDQV